MKQIETDVVVIGSGASGMAAACTAAERGLRVTILEKGDSMGGSVAGGNGVFAVESRMQREKQLSFSREDAFKFFMDFTQWRGDARLVSDYINKSANTVEWLENMGINFIDVVAYFSGANYTWHFKDPNSPNITDAIFEKAKKFGTTIHLGTPVKKILSDGTRIVGVMADDKNGETIQVQAKAVIIATGGFGGNAEWIKAYTGYEYGVNLFSFAFPEMQGEGIRMAWEVGAAESEMMIDTYVSMPGPIFGPGGTSYELGAFRQPNLMVNQWGERFMNEEYMRNPAYAANAVHRQKDGCAFMIFDEATNIYYEEKGWEFLLPGIPFAKSDNIGAIIKKAQEDGYEHLFMAESLEELSEKTGIDLHGLRETMQEYNKACETGRDEIFHKKTVYLRPVKVPKFYAARFYLSGYGSLGGIKINYKTEVLNKDQVVIPGLYAIGNDANALYGGTYPFALSGNASAFCFNTGRIAGENVSEYIKSAPE